MSDQTMLLHCGANRVVKGDLVDVPTPSPTATWHPLPHHRLLGQVETFIRRAGFGIAHEEHALSHEGARYFGLMEIDTEGDYGLVVGVRNSHDKTFPAGLAVGSHVFVCDNLSFSSEISIARKHTRYIERDLPSLVAKAVGRLGDHRQLQNKRIAAYREREICDPLAHDFIINAVDCQALPASKIPALLQEWRNPQHEDFKPRTVWSLFNSFTEVYKTVSNPQVLLKRTQALHGLADSFCGIAS